MLPEERGNSSPLWHLGLSESTMRGWSKYCDRIFQAYLLGKHSVDPRMDVTLQSKNTWQYSSANVTASFCLCTLNSYSSKQELARDASRSWALKFMRRVRFSLHRKTPILPKAPVRERVITTGVSTLCDQLPHRSDKKCGRDSNLFGQSSWLRY